MNHIDFEYIDSPFHYKREQSCGVSIGSVVVGDGSRIKIQSMTDTDTKDVTATTLQIIEIVESGADIVRVTVQGMREVEALEQIKRDLIGRGVTTPIVADVHFNPSAAERAISIVEKVRINPGNFYDPRAKFNLTEYSEKEYSEELAAIQDKFALFIRLCKSENKAIRIGANHGSLSDRIMSRFGDTPQGIVESVVEFLDVCKREEFSNVVISIKSSNTRVMVYTTRLLNHYMRRSGVTYPLHIGVTEAGEGEDGRVVSAVGSGALLADGLGDTIRVSLTENPASEVPFARKLVETVKRLEGAAPIELSSPLLRSPFSYSRRVSKRYGSIGGDNPPVVALNRGQYSSCDKSKVSVDCLYGQNKLTLLEEGDNKSIDLVAIRMNWKEFLALDNKTQLFNEDSVLLFEASQDNFVAEVRAVIAELEAIECSIPVVGVKQYRVTDYEELLLESAIDFGSLIIDGHLDGIAIELAEDNIDIDQIVDLAYGLLQAGRARVTKMEFISCPGCGRTLFDLQDRVKEVKRELAHLKPLKIGVMGCIVNGPGEMGDVDYGYVGSGRGKVDLYRGQKLIKRGIPTEEAMSELRLLIESNGDWIELDK